MNPKFKIGDLVEIYDGRIGLIKELEERSVEIAFAEIRNQSGGVNLNPKGSEFHGGSRYSAIHERSGH